MSTYPETPKPAYPLIITPRFRTIVSGMDSGVEERTSKWLFAKYDVTVQYKALTATNAQTIWNFYIARKGSAEAFYIYDLSLLASITKVHEDQYIATADGTTLIYDIPGRSTSSQVIYSDGIVVSASLYSILTAGGVSSSDRVSFTAAPAEGAVITCDFAGYLRIRARFKDDMLSYELFTTNLFNLGAELTGLAPA